MPKLKSSTLAQRRAEIINAIHTTLASTATPMTAKQIAFAVPCSLHAAERAIETDPKLFALFTSGRIALPDTVKGRHRWLRGVKNSTKITYLNKAERSIDIPLPERMVEIEDEGIRKEVEAELTLSRAASIRINASPAKIVEMVDALDTLRIDAALRQQNNEATATAKYAKLEAEIEKRITSAVDRAMEMLGNRIANYGSVPIPSAERSPVAHTA